jgi:uncharacterized protein YndB with AHSA1/START domain
MKPSKQIQLRRSFAAPAEAVWALWTTKDGIESWWGPLGFAVTVHAIDLRPGGRLDYTMTAVAPDQIGFMNRAGMPLAHTVTITYTEVVPLRRLAYINLVDFVPGVAAYEVGTLVDLRETAAGVDMTLTLDAMHDQMWTERAVAGWESELGKLEALVGQRASS